MKFSTTGLVGRWAVIAGVAIIGAACSDNPAERVRKSTERGNRFFAEKKYAESVIEYRRALQADPRAPDAQYKLAQAYDQLGDGPNAAREYVRAADILVDNADAQVRAGVLLLAGRNFEDAKTRALKALAIAPKNVEAHMLLAEATAMTNDLTGAVSEIERTIEMDPGESRSYTRIARYQLLQGDAAKAERSFKRAVEIDPQALDTVLALARFYLTTGRSSDAEQWLKRARELAPADAQVNRTLAALYISSGRMGEAEEPLKVYAEASPSAVGRLTLADYYFQQKRLADARRVLQPFTTDRDFAGQVLSRLAVVEMAEGHEKEAFDLLKEALTRNSNDVEALVLRGRFLAAQRKYPEALASLKSAVTANPKAAHAHYYLGAVLLETADADSAVKEFTEVLKLEPAELGSKLQLARIYVSQGKASEALSFATDVVRAQPQNAIARIVQVDALMATGNLQKAASEAKAVSAALPDIPEPHMQLARIALAQRDYPAAERSFERARQLFGSDARAMDAFGGIVAARVESGHLADAHTIVDEQIRRNPKSAPLYLYSAGIYRAERDQSRVEAALKRALEIDGENLAAMSELAQFYSDQESFDEARKYLEGVVAKQPKAIWAHTLIAIGLERQGRIAEAQQRYEKILQIDPDAAMAANNLAMLYIASGDNLDLALQHAQGAKRVMPNAPEIDDTLGLVYLKKRLPDLAIASFKSAVAADQKNGEYAYHLGMAYEQKEDKRQARAMFERALALSPDFQGAADARVRLAASR